MYWKECQMEIDGEFYWKFNYFDIPRDLTQAGITYVLFKTEEEFLEYFEEEQNKKRK